MKNLLLALILIIAACTCIWGQSRQSRSQRSVRNRVKEVEAETTRRDYGDTYATFNSRGEMSGLYNRANCSYIGCSRTVTQVGTITKVESSGDEIYGFRIKYTNGKNGKWEGLSNDFGGLWFSNAQNLIAPLIHVGKRVKIISCGCGSGAIPAIESITVK